MTQDSNQSLFPLTSPQRGVWFDQMLHPDSPLYNMAAYLQIDGFIDRNVFEAAIQLLIQQNDALRIVMRKGKDLPQQEFLSSLTVPLDYLDLSHRQHPLEECLFWMREYIDRPFQLYDSPLFRFSLIKISEACYCWLHNYHHLIIDAYANSLLAQRLAKIYTALIRGQPVDAGPIYPYRDYIVEDLAYLESRKFSQDAQYWKEKFCELPDCLIERKSFGDKIQHRRSILTLPRVLYDRMISASAQRGASTFHLILTALYVYFVRTAGRDDFMIGLPTLNRSTAVFKRTVGLFTGISPAWFRLGSDLNAAELMKSIGRELRKDYKHQRAPLQEINRIVGLYNEGRVQLFDILLTYEKQSYDVEFDGHLAEEVSLRHGGEQTPFALEISEYNSQLDVRMNIDFSVTAFTDEEIELFKGRFLSILEQIAQCPEIPIQDLEILPAKERHLVLSSFNSGRQVYACPKTLAELFEEEAEKTPEAIALVCEGKQLTYRALNRRANQVAHMLRSHGVGPDVPAGICLERSAELVIGILGILKAGGAYVPLDPSYPTERLAFMLQDADIHVLITQESLTTALPKLKEVLPIYLDKDGGAIAGAGDANQRVGVSPDSPAYVIYTSGSTGKPKGTLVSHDNVARLFAATHSLYQFGPRDVWTLFHSIAFDFSVWEIFGALLHGGRLVVVPYWVSRSPDLFYRLLSEQQVTILNQTPSAFNHLISAEEAYKAPLPLSLRWVIFGGEALNPQDLKPWFDRHGDQTPKLMNMYGITETTVHVTYRPLSMGDLQPARSMIGWPISDLQVYILDENMRPVPVGVRGEMYVGGRGVAIGYLNRPELTAQRFLSDPFRNGPGARLYKTGDLAWYLPDGDIQYLGRIDDQVKIRGFRVELGEIKSALEAHAGVRACVVIARTNPNTAEAAETQILAYIIPKLDVVLDITELRAFLRQTLPDYMIPAAFITLAALPLTLNGKIDRRALPMPEADHPRLNEVFIEPRHNMEKRIAHIWKEVLRLDRVGIHDNFFELGGHSLLMVRIRGKLEEAFGRSLSMAEMFQCPTIHTLSQQLCRDDDEATAMPPSQEALETRTARRDLQAHQREIRKQSRELKTRE
jgi:amino acid adenylation domain-containing protein